MSEHEHHTLLLRLAGPLQSWGTNSRHEARDTGYEPSKSGVIGVLAAALGHPRDEDLAQLAALQLGVRVDQEGVPGYDYQTAGAGNFHPGIAKADESERQIQARLQRARRGVWWNKGLHTSTSKRDFLQDAIFLVGLEGDDLAFLTELDAALRAPVYPIGLGRRSYVPSVPVAMPPTDAQTTGVRENTSLIDALKAESWPAARINARAFRQAQGTVRRFVLESRHAADGTIRDDQPIGAAFSTRVFGPRIVEFQQWTTPLERNPE